MELESSMVVGHIQQEHHWDISTMEKTNDVFKICSRCLFRVPWRRAMCKTCGSSEFVCQDQTPETAPERSVVVELPKLMRMLHLTTNRRQSI